MTVIPLFTSTFTSWSTSAVTYDSAPQLTIQEAIKEEQEVIGAVEKTDQNNQAQK